MSWHGQLTLNYRLDGERTTALDRHHGPLRVLQRLYPESERVCHHVLVHPPGGIVGGDVLDIDLHMAPGSHALLTTPGATRFYKTQQAEARQNLIARVENGARLEWPVAATPGIRTSRSCTSTGAPGASRQLTRLLLSVSSVSAAVPLACTSMASSRSLVSRPGRPASSATAACVVGSTAVSISDASTLQVKG